MGKIWHLRPEILLVSAGGTGTLPNRFEGLLKKLPV